MKDHLKPEINKHGYQSTVYWRSFVSNLEMFLPKEQDIREINIDLDETCSLFLQRLASDKERPLQIVFITVFNSLVNRFFYEKSLCKIRVNQSNLLLYSLEKECYGNLKESISGTKEQFSALFKHRNYGEEEVSLDAFADCTLSIGAEPLRSSFDNFELNVLLPGKEILIRLFYDQNKMPYYLVDNFSKYIGYALNNLEDFFNGNQLINEFLIHTDSDLIALTNATKHKYPEDETVITIFEEQVDKNPSAIAVQHIGAYLTYSEFNVKVNRFCDFLKKNHHVSGGDIIALDLSKSIDMPVAIFGILKTGSAYLPIDSKLPSVRKDFILEDSGAKLVVNNQLMDAFNTVVHELSPANPARKSDTSDLAYVIYTSGSTGMPKGVMIEHGGLVNRLLWMQESYSLTEKDILVQKTNYAFDVSVWEMLWWSLFGASLSIPVEGIEKDPEELLNEIHQQDITVIHFVPSMLVVFLDYLHKNEDKLTSLKSLKQVYVSGEALPNTVRDNFFRLLPDISLMNLYGPTEATIDATYFDCRNVALGANSIPIGKPIWNTKIHILDDMQYPVPIGTVGNLHIEGVGLAKGYLNRGDLTSEKFIENPSLLSRIYNSGDLARWLPDGNIEFIGRRDFQVKIRGNRVELGDIENTMMSYSEGLSQAIVTANERDGGHVLVGYYVSRSDKIEKTMLRSFLQDRLPEYMVPSYLIALDSIPLTANGKIDRKSLQIVTDEDLLRKEYVAPRNITEEKLVSIWEEVLSVENVSITDNFFELGGHSLMVGKVLNKIRQKLSQEISFRDFFIAPTIEGISEKLNGKEYRPICKAPDRESYPLTPSQRRLWILSQLEGGSSAYNMPAVVTLKGNVHIDFLERAFRNLIDRHEILRTSFRTDSRSGDVNQYIAEFGHIEFNISEFDFTEKTSQEIAEYLNAFNEESFDLQNAPLLKVSFLKRSKEEYILFLSMHHLIGDGWSTELLISEVVGNYNSLLKGEEPANREAPLPIQYRDYSVWMEGEREQEKYKRAESYWLGQFEGELPVLNLPSYRPRPLVQTYNGDHIRHVFSDEFTVKIKAFSQRNGVTMFMTLVAGIKALLYRYTGECDIIVGTPVAGRDHPDLENQIGLYLNTLAIRTRFEEEGGNSFASLLEKEKEASLSAYEHQCYPFDELVSKLDIKRDRSRSPLFDVLVVMQNQRELIYENSTEDLDGLSVESYNYNRKTSQFDISYTFTEEDTLLGLTIGYNTDIYDRFLIERMFAHFLSLLTQIMNNMHIDIEEIDFLTELERKQLLEDLNNSKVSYPKDKTVVQLFEEQVENNPNNIAVVFDGVEITYKELNTGANRIANYLRDVFHIQANDLIAIKLDHGHDVVETLLGVLKSGAAYVPIDSEFPDERVNMILSESKPKLVIDTQSLSTIKQDAFTYSLDNPKLNSLKESLVYVIYTSGTTGIPKGVQICALNILDYYYGLSEKIDLNANESYGMMSTIVTDLGNTVLFSSLFSGKKLHVFTKNQLRNFSYMTEYFEKNPIDCIKIVPSLWKAFKLPSSCYPKKMIIFGGESLGGDIVKNVQRDRSDVSIVNHYGPTETTIGKLMFFVPNNCNSQQIPIGKVFSNNKLLIVDRFKNLVPIGVEGELLIGGDGLSSGYLNNLELTGDSFIWLENQRFYRTGDLVRYLPDGNIEFLGRKDSQVKVRGYRIELREIELNVSLYSKDVLNQVVVATEVNGAEALILYFATGSNGPKIDKLALRSFLYGCLPDHMVPSYFVELQFIPLTGNGKIDKASLPVVKNTDLVRRKYIAPQTETEQKLVKIWQDVLRVEDIGITDDFFELGGHSLMVAQTINRIHQNLELTISFKDFFSFPSIEGLLKNLAKRKFNSIPKAPKQDSYPLTPSQRRLWMLSQLEGGSQAYNMPGVVAMKGTLDLKCLERAFYYLLERHEILRTTFRIDSRSGDVCQYITRVEDLIFSINHVDFTGDAIDKIDAYLHISNKESFNLQRAPLLKVILLKRDENDFLMFLSMHHIIGDGWSTELMISEVVKSYNSLLKGEEIKSKSSPLFIQYRDYAVWLQDQKGQKKYKQAESYWLEQFKGDLPVLELPSLKTRPLVQTYNGDRVSHTFTCDFTERIRSYSEKQGVTLFVTLMAGVKTLLYRYTSQRDIIVGTPIAGREHPDIENQLGLYLNTLAIRTRLEEEYTTFESLLQQEKNTLLSAYDYQIYPFDELVGKLNLNRDNSRSTLFDVLVVLQNHHQLQFGQKNHIEGLQVEKYEYNRKTSQFDVSYIFEEDSTHLRLDIEYNTDIYDEFLIKRMFFHFENLMISAIENASEVIEKIDFLTHAEREQLLVEFNNTKVDYPREKTFVHLFEEQVVKTPDKVAIVCYNDSFNYSELNNLANRFARFLVVNFKVNPGDIVGVKVQKSHWSIVVLLGILKSGAAYVPIDPEYPEHHRKKMEDIVKCKVSINEENISQFIKIKDSFSPDKIEVHIDGDSLFHIMFTSGTTGDPKGVMIKHSNITNFIITNDYFPLNKKTILLSTVSISFDTTNMEFWSALANGAKVVLARKTDLLNTNVLKDIILKNKVNSIWFTASWFSQISDDDISVFEPLERVISGGSTLSPRHINYLISNYPRLQIFNGYGPTENTTFSTVFRIRDFDEQQRPISIGSPIGNTQIYILNENQKPQPIAVLGKIFVSGDNLSSGYFNNHTLTNIKFLSNIFEFGCSKMYDTGDLGRWMPDGTVEFIGRQDNVIKIRGHRVELADIDRAILMYTPNIENSISINKDLADHSVIASYIKLKSPVNKQALFNFLERKLPFYMLPSYITEIDSIPITPNGKFDEKELPELTDDSLVRAEYVPPVGKDEKSLSIIWSEILKIERVGITDSFFSLGGNSLMVTQLMNKVRQKLGFDFSFVDFFGNPTIQGMTKYVARECSIDIVNNSIQRNYPLSPAQRRMWILNEMEKGNNSYVIPSVLHLTGDLSLELLQKSFDILVNRHDILRTLFYLDFDENEVRQRVMPAEKDYVKVKIFNSINTSDGVIADLINELHSCPFDLKKGPLLRVSLIKKADQEYLLSILIHHIISDGWSMEILKNEVISNYNRLYRRVGVTDNMRSLPMQYQDYTLWLSKQFDNSRFI